MKDSNILKYFKNDVVKLNDKDAYEFYKKHRKYSCFGIDEYIKFKSIVGKIFLEIARAIKEEEDGVYIPYLGYFCGVKKRVRRKNNSLLLKKEVANAFFFPDEPIAKWNMQYTIKDRITQDISTSNIKYKPNFKLVESYMHHKADANLRLGYHAHAEDDINYNPKLRIINELT